MPLYTYICDNCHYEFEEYRGISDRNAPLGCKCKQCGKVSVRRLYKSQGYLDKGILDADKNMERSGVLKELERIKEHHPYMRWTG